MVRSKFPLPWLFKSMHPLVIIAILHLLVTSIGSKTTDPTLCNRLKSDTAFAIKGLSFVHGRLHLLEAAQIYSIPSNYIDSDKRKMALFDYSQSGIQVDDTATGDVRSFVEIIKNDASLGQIRDNVKSNVKLSFEQSTSQKEVRLYLHDPKPIKPFHLELSQNGPLISQLPIYGFIMDDTVHLWDVHRRHVLILQYQDLNAKKSEFSVWIVPFKYYFACSQSEWDQVKSGARMENIRVPEWYGTDSGVTSAAQDETRSVGTEDSSNVIVKQSSKPLVDSATESSWNKQLFVFLTIAFVLLVCAIAIGCVIYNGSGKCSYRSFTKARKDKRKKRKGAKHSKSPSSSRIKSSQEELKSTRSRSESGIVSPSQKKSIAQCGPVDSVGTPRSPISATQSIDLTKQSSSSTEPSEEQPNSVAQCLTQMDTHKE